MPHLAEVILDGRLILSQNGQTWQRAALRTAAGWKQQEAVGGGRRAVPAVAVLAVPAAQEPGQQSTHEGAC